MLEVETYINDNRVVVDLDVIIKEGLARLKSSTRVEITNYAIEDNKIMMELSGADENIRVLKDRLGIQEETNALTNSAVDKVKKSLYNTLEKEFGDNLSIRLRSIEDYDKELIHISMEATLDTIPYPIFVQYHIADDGYLNVSYHVFGDISKDEKWAATSITAEKLIQRLHEIEDYYSVRRIEE